MNKLKFEEKLIELEQTSNNFWNIPRVTGYLLNSLIKSHGFVNVLEVGTSNGYSALWITEALKVTNGKFTGIEFYQKRIDLAEQNLKDCGLFDEKVNIIQGQANKVIEELQEEFDMVFLDANKPEYIDYYVRVKDKIKKNGLLIADNIDSHREKVQNFLDAIYADKDFQVSHLNYPGGLILAFKVDHYLK